MVNKFVKNKIIKDNLPLVGIGAIILIGSILLFWLIWQAGFMVGLIVVGILFGAVLLIFGIIGLVYWPSNNIYKNWKFYGGNDSIIDEIQNVINNKKKDLDLKEFIISDDWIIKQKEFIFVRLKDINWIFLSKTGNKNSNIYQQKIKIHTNFGLKFEINCSKIKLDSKESDLTTQDVSMYLNTLNQYCKNAIFGYKKEFESIWKKSPKDFIKNINIDAFTERH